MMGHMNCPKHVEFHSKDMFEKLVYLVGFIVGTHHDARSLERQIQNQRNSRINSLATKINPKHHFACLFIELVKGHDTNVNLPALYCSFIYSGICNCMCFFY